MGLDVVQIALSSMTDATEFERLASEVMRSEGYRDIQPLGGTADRCQDARDTGFLHATAPTPTVFQYSLQEDVGAKLQATGKCLIDAGVDYLQLVYVTTRSLPSGRVLKLEEDYFRDFQRRLKIYDQKTLINRLSDYQNGLFNRHFPNIESQLADIARSRPRLAPTDASAMELNRLRASLAYTFSPVSHAARRDVLDQLALSVLADCVGTHLDTESLTHRIREAIPSIVVERSMVDAACNRLARRGDIESTAEGVSASPAAVERFAATITGVDDITSNLLDEVVDIVAEVASHTLSEADRERVRQNARGVFVALFELFGVELTNKVLAQRPTAPVFFEGTQHLVAIAERNVSASVGRAVVDVLANVIHSPTSDQAKALELWAKAYLALAVLNLDPGLKELQQSRLRTKTFIIDTDFLLSCVVKETTEHSASLRVLAGLVRTGCRVVVPEASFREALTHAMISPRTYDYFGLSLHALPPDSVEMQVHNVFVKGYYHARRSNLVRAETSFQAYLANYFDAEASETYFRDVLRDSLGDGVEVVPVSSLLADEFPNERYEQLLTALHDIHQRSRKAQFRDAATIRTLAESDARLYAVAEDVNRTGGSPSSSILGRRCYIVTSSAKFLRATRAVGSRDELTTRPQSLAGLLALVGATEMEAEDYVRLFENPLLLASVDASWNDVRALAQSGVDLSDKSLPRLRRDLDSQLHQRLAASIADLDKEPDVSVTTLGAMLTTAQDMGYRLMPPARAVLTLLQTGAEVMSENTEILDRLRVTQEELKKIGKRKERHLRRYLREGRKRR
jgi:hypothetical protein